jgi:hypothetical protein
LIHSIQFDQNPLRRRCSSYVNSFICFRTVSVYERACSLNLVPDSETMPTGVPHAARGFVLMLNNQEMKTYERFNAH